MSNLSSKKNQEQSWIQNLKNLGIRTIFAIFLLAASDLLVLTIPFYLKTFLPNLQFYLKVSESDVSSLSSVVGWIMVLCQLPGGWFADKFSAKKLLSISTILTGVITIWFGTLIFLSSQISYYQLLSQYYVIYGLWGISTTLFFWAPLLKLISQQGDNKTQGFAYGLEGSMYGIIGLLLIFTVCTIITQNVISNNETNSIDSEINSINFAIYVFCLSAFTILIGVLSWFFIKDKNSDVKYGVNFKLLLRILCDWKWWALSVFMMGLYTFQAIIFYYLNQMLANVIKISTLWLLIIQGIRLYGTRFIIASFAGKFADKFRSFTLLLIIITLIGLILISIFLFLPGISNNNLTNSFDNLDSNYKLFASIFMCLIVVLISFISSFIYTLRYAQMAEVRIITGGYGSASALISFIGFTGDGWFYQMGSVIAKNYTTNNQTVSQTGYQIIIGIGMIVVLIGILAGLAVYLYNTKLLKKHNINYYRWRTLHNE